MEKKLKHAVEVQCNIIDNFMEINNKLDSDSEEDESEEPKKRRKKWSRKEYEFSGVTSKVAQEDLDEIYNGTRNTPRYAVPTDFKKNDVVTCILGKKKYKGDVFQVTDKGLSIKTSDRKKIKILWENIIAGNIQLIKVKDGAKH